METLEIANIVNDDQTMLSYINGNAFEALTQIIHNSLDADASLIKISIKYNNLGAIELVRVEDNGLGIKQPNKNDIMDTFLRRGFSEKKVGQRNKFNRNMHGKNGDGRFKSYALGAVVEWVSKTKDSSCKIIGNYNDPQRFQYTTEYDASFIKTETGTIFTAYANDRDIKLYEHDKLKYSLERHFITVIEDERISIYLDGEKLTVSEHVDAEETNNLDAPFKDVQVKTVIWKQFDNENNRLFWCDQSYNILREDRLDHTVKKTNCSLYIASKRVEEEKKNNTLELLSSNPDFVEIEKHARSKKDSFLLKQSALKSYDIINKLKDENIYPYSKTTSSADVVAQNLYDKIIVKINEKKPNVLKNKDTKHFIVKTVKVLLEKEPEHFANILKELLNLSTEDTIEFSKLLNQTELSNIIRTSTMVSNRLKFIEALKLLVYGDLAKNLKERSQLHKMLVNETWIFGEEYNLTASDQSFNKTIQKIRESVSGMCDDEIEGGHRIPDLFFTSKQFYGDQQWALIVELKRPKVSIGKKELQQIKDYYDIIKSCPEFANWKVDLLVVSSDIDKTILEGEIQDCKTGRANYYKDDPLKKIFIRRWGDILDQNAFRYKSLKQSLDISADLNDGAKYIKDNYASMIDKA